MNDDQNNEIYMLKMFFNFSSISILILSSIIHINFAIKLKTMVYRMRVV
jgi:hypothetical protein